MEVKKVKQGSSRSLGSTHSHPMSGHDSNYNNVVLNIGSVIVVVMIITTSMRMIVIVVI